jgi:hypothetical protein
MTQCNAMLCDSHHTPAHDLRVAPHDLSHATGQIASADVSLAGAIYCSASARTNNRGHQEITPLNYLDSSDAVGEEQSARSQ